MIRTIFLVFFAVLFFSCGSDDNLNVEVVPPLLLGDVAIEDDAEIREFLQTHFYNYEEFQSPPAGFDFKIKIDTISGENQDKTPLIDQVSSAVINVSSSEFNLREEEEDIPHTYYYLSARDGINENPTVADSVFVRYEGTLLDGTAFDAALNNPVWFDLARIQGPLQGFRGFAEGVPNFKPGGATTGNPDGTVSVEEYGVGWMIFPSGLGSFNSPTGSIPAYSPLIFAVDLYTINTTDHDNDGIPSILEDIDGNGFLYDDNTDEEDELEAGFLPAVNFLDIDDDEDGTNTRDEIIIDGDGNITFPDTDGDGVPDYLDKDNS
ncbi:MAG: FKBP-type peptidyl-prolyl cis-trans isomerase [Bacteroidota bacterium]